MKKTMLRKSSGVALVTAIFLLVVLAGLAVAVVSLTTTQQTTSSQDEQGARAYQAAKAGLEWALFRQLRGGGLCPATTTFAMPRNTTLSAFTVTVTCAAAPPGYGVATGTDPTANHFLITAVACNSPLGTACPAPTNSADYIQRQLQAQL